MIIPLFRAFSEIPRMPAGFTVDETPYGIPSGETCNFSRCMIE